LKGKLKQAKRPPHVESNNWIPSIDKIEENSNRLRQFLTVSSNEIGTLNHEVSVREKIMS
jgi:hypothetical protein